MVHRTYGIRRSGRQPLAFQRIGAARSDEQTRSGEPERVTEETTMDEAASDTEPDVYELLVEAATACRRAAKSMLDAYAANALPNPAPPEDLAFWKQELADAKLELARLHSSNQD